MRTISSALSERIDRRRAWLGRAGIALATMMVTRTPAISAQSPIGRTYVAIDGGFAVGPSTEARTGKGLTGGVGLGHQWLSRLAGQIDAHGEWFPAPGGVTVYTAAPCADFCPVPSGPSPGSVSMLTLTGDAVIGPEDAGPGGFLLAGAGMRYLASDPVERRRGSAIAQLGMGAAVPIGVHALLIGARVQRALSDTRAFQWMVPLTVTWRN